MADLSLDLEDDRHRPYFLWDESTTTGELREALRTAERREWARLVGKVMREARDQDVWRFVTPEEVWQRFDDIRRHLGRRRAFWEYLLRGWQSDGLLP